MPFLSTLPAIQNNLKAVEIFSNPKLNLFLHFRGTHFPKTIIDDGDVKNSDSNDNTVTTHF